MTKKVLIEIRELEAAAERAGGYVTTPWDRQADAAKCKEFSALRQYSLKTGKPMSRFVDADYISAGVKPYKPNTKR